MGCIVGKLIGRMLFSSFVSVLRIFTPSSFDATYPQCRACEAAEALSGTQPFVYAGILYVL